MKEVVILGGPNGAGKTSWAFARLQPALRIREFINADEIARGLSPFNPDGVAIPAGRLLIERIHALAAAGSNFAFETTCAGRGHLRLLKMLRERGYRITLIFLWLPSVEIALARVSQRVAEGGHDIPKPVVIRRYKAGLRNLLDLYLPVADIALIYDNADSGDVLIAERGVDGQLEVYDRERWSQIEEAAK